MFPKILTTSTFALFIAYSYSIFFGIGLLNSLLLFTFEELIARTVTDDNDQRSLHVEIINVTMSHRQILLIAVAFCLIMCVSSCLFVTGIKMRRPKFIRPWLFMNLIVIIGTFFASFYFAVSSSYDASWAMTGFASSVSQCIIYKAIYLFYLGISNKDSTTAAIDDFVS